MSNLPRVMRALQLEQSAPWPTMTFALWATPNARCSDVGVPSPQSRRRLNRDLGTDRRSARNSPSVPAVSGAPGRSRSVAEDSVQDAFARVVAHSEQAPANEGIVPWFVARCEMRPWTSSGVGVPRSCI